MQARSCSASPGGAQAGQHDSRAGQRQRGRMVRPRRRGCGSPSRQAPRYGHGGNQRAIVRLRRPLLTAPPSADRPPQRKHAQRHSKRSAGCSRGARYAAAGCPGRLLLLRGRRRRRRRRRRRQSQRGRVRNSVRRRASLPLVSYLVIHVGVLRASGGLDAARAEPGHTWAGPQARIKKCS